jgi:hypothetical protein
MLEGCATPDNMKFVDSTAVLAETTVKLCKRIIELDDVLAKKL